MKIGYNEATGKGCSTLAQDLLLCEQAGFDYIELRLDMLHTYLQTHTLDDLTAFFAGSGLKPHALNAIYIYETLFTRADARRAAFMAEFQFACQTAAAIGAGHIIVVPPLSPDRITPYRGARPVLRDRCAAIMRRLGEIAAEQNVRLCFELVGAPYSSVRTVAQAKVIVEQTDLENVGYVFDAYNLYLDGKLSDFTPLLTVDPGKIFAVHLNDGDDVPVGEMGQDKRCFCGDGVVDLGAFLGVLKQIHYDGMASIETFRPEYWHKPAPWVVDAAYHTTKDTLAKYGCL